MKGFVSSVGSLMLVTSWGVPAEARAQAGAIVTTGLSANLDAQPGELVRSSVELNNLGLSPWTGTVRLGDYRTDADQMYFDPPGTGARSAAGWMVLEPATITLEPGARGVVTYTIQVPDDPNLRGSYWGVLLIQDLDAKVMAEEATRGFQVKQESQTAVRVNVEVATGAKAELVFDSINLEPSDEGNRLDLVVSNPGERWGKVTPRIELFAADGTRLGPLEAPERSLYPGSNWKYTIPLQGIPAGDYAMLVVAEASSLGAFATRRALHVP